MARNKTLFRVGLRVTELRGEKGWTQEELGHRSGLHRAYVGQVERGEKNIGLRNLEKIAKALGVKVQDLL